MYAGDFIRYVICKPLIPLQRSLGDRAYSIPEIRASNGTLQPDIDWYLRNQLLPTVNRLISPIDEIPRSYLCECLGLEVTSVEGEGSGRDELNYISAFVPRVRV